MQLLILDNYLQKIAKKPKTEAKTRIQEMVTPYLQEIAWSEDGFEQNMRLFWITVYQYMKNHTDHELIKLMDWFKGKALHPLQAIRALKR